MFQKYSTAEQLCSNTDFLQTLAAMAFLLVGSTFSTERTHSKNARRVRVAAHTNVKSIENMALSHVGAARPAWMQRALESHGQKRKKGDIQFPLAAATHSDRNATAGSADTTAVGEKRRGGGGAWRAFLHYRVHHLGEHNDFKKLGQQYAELQPHEKQWYKELGAQGVHLSDFSHLTTNMHYTNLHLATCLMVEHLPWFRVIKVDKYTKL
eukprot:2046509-Amphidinium_carterae.1